MFPRGKFNCLNQSSNWAFFTNRKLNLTLYGYSYHKLRKWRFSLFMGVIWHQKYEKKIQNFCMESKEKKRCMPAKCEYWIKTIKNDDFSVIWHLPLRLTLTMDVASKSRDSYTFYFYICSCFFITVTPQDQGNFPGIKSINLLSVYVFQFWMWIVNMLCTWHMHISSCVYHRLY